MYRYKLSCIGIVASNAHFDFRMGGQTDHPAREAVVGGRCVGVPKRDT